MYSEVMITDQRDEIKNLKQQIYYLQYQLDILTQKIFNYKTVPFYVLASQIYIPASNMTF